MKKIILILVIAIFVIADNVFSQGYKIEVKIKGTENQQLILGHHKNANLIPDDTVKTDSKGYAIFKGDINLTGGMYFIFLEKSTYFDFILGDDQIFSIENDTIDLFKNLIFKGSDENMVFKNYQMFLVEQNKKLADLKTKKESTTDEAEKSKIDTEMGLLTTEYLDYYNSIQTNYPTLFIAKFLKATRPVEVPTTITDRTAQYYYYRFHYFDNFDISDVRLLLTPIYEEKITNYLDNVVINHPDTLIHECDLLLSKTEHDSELYKYMMIYLFNKFAKSQLMAAENVYVHLGYKYIDKATWDTDSFKTQLKPKLDKKAKCLVGNKAIDINMQILPNDSMKIEFVQSAITDFREKGLKIEEDKTRTLIQKSPELSLLISEYMGVFPSDYIKLQDVKAKYTILWFMEPDCSHCKKETPLFYQEYVDNLKELDVAVWCVYLHRDIDDWNKFCDSMEHWYDFIQNNEMYEWYNLWNPFDLYRDNYDISSSPVLFLLDENKTIIGKRIGYEQAAEMIKSIEGVKID
jgi:hypothetical protein